MTDDAIGRRQPQARAFAGLLGGEERLEEVVSRGAVHAHARVGDREEEVWTGLDVEMRDGVGLVDEDILGLDGDRSAVWHRVSGVDDEIDKDLVELPRIAPYGAGVPVEIDDEPHVFADQLTNHGFEAVDRGVEAEDPRPDHLLAAERQ